MLGPAVALGLGLVSSGTELDGLVNRILEFEQPSPTMLVGAESLVSLRYELARGEVLASRNFRRVLLRRSGDQFVFELKEYELQPGMDQPSRNQHGREFIYLWSDVLRCLYYVQQNRADLYDPGDISADVLLDDLPDAVLFGFLPGNTDRLSTLVSRAHQVHLGEAGSVVGFEARDGGAYSLLLGGPDSPIIRIQLQKDGEDLFNGVPLSSPLRAWVDDAGSPPAVTEYDSILEITQYSRIGDRTVPTAASRTATTTFSDGSVCHEEVTIRRTRVELDVEFPESTFAAPISEGAMVRRFSEFGSGAVFRWKGNAAAPHVPQVHRDALEATVTRLGTVNELQVQAGPIDQVERRTSVVPYWLAAAVGIAAVGGVIGRRWLRG